MKILEKWVSKMTSKSIYNKNLSDHLSFSKVRFSIDVYVVFFKLTKLFHLNTWRKIKWSETKVIFRSRNFIKNFFLILKADNPLADSSLIWKTWNFFFELNMSTFQMLINSWSSNMKSQILKVKIKLSLGDFMEKNNSSTWWGQALVTFKKISKYLIDNYYRKCRRHFESII